MDINFPWSRFQNLKQVELADYDYNCRPGISIRDTDLSKLVPYVTTAKERSHIRKWVKQLNSMERGDSLRQSNSLASSAIIKTWKWVKQLPSSVKVIASATFGLCLINAANNASMSLGIVSLPVLVLQDHTTDDLQKLRFNLKTREVVARHMSDELDFYSLSEEAILEEFTRRLARDRLL